jgi:hypothetical protein
MSKKRSKRNTKASLKALQAKRKTYSKGSRVKKAPGGFNLTPEMLARIQQNNNSSGTKGGPSAGIDPAIAARVAGETKEKQPVDTGTVKTPDPEVLQTAEPISQQELQQNTTPVIRSALDATTPEQEDDTTGLTKEQQQTYDSITDPDNKAQYLAFINSGGFSGNPFNRVGGQGFYGRPVTPAIGDSDPSLTPKDDEGDKTSLVDDTLNPDLSYEQYPVGYQTRAHLESSIDYSKAPPFPVLADYPGDYPAYLKAYEAHKAGPYAVFMENPPKKTGSENDLPVNENTEDKETVTDRKLLTTVERIGLPADAPTGIVLNNPNLTEDQIAAQTRTVTKTALGQKLSSDIDILKVAAASGTPEQQRIAKETLQSLGLSTDIQQLDNTDDNRPSATSGVISDENTDRSIAQTQGATKDSTLQSKFDKGPDGNFLANKMSADTATAASMAAAQGELSAGSTAEAARANFTDANKVQTATRDSAQEQAALADNVEFQEDARSQVGEVSFRKDITVSPTPEAEFKTRDGITDNRYAEREANQIIDKIGFVAAQRRTVTGEAAKGAAATMLAQVGELPPEITAVIVEDPATVTAQVNNEPVEVQAAIAALPTEALVSSQMETLLAGMDEGTTPVWARPAVAQVESMMAQRGLSASTVARDSLFNAIIQTALPIAQSNAQALQARATQNLNNQQQANMSTATLDAQRRLANLSNEQTSASQTAQMAQQMSTMQSQFRQDAVMTTEQIAQQTRVQNLANQQETAKINAANQQQINAQELGNAQQIELAEMQYQNVTNSENMSAEQQQRLTDFQVAADFLAKNANFKQQMDLANMSNEQQTRLANLTALNAADADSLTALQQTELANLNTKMQTNLTQAKIAESMGVAQLSVDQQRAITNAATIAKIDLTKFSTEQQVELANSQFMQTATLTDYSARQQSAIQNATTLAQMDMQAADLATKTRISNAQNFLKMDLANLNNRQQEQVLNAQMEQQTALSNQAALNAAKQFNATSQNQVDTFMTGQANQMEQFNASQTNAMSQFNVSEANKIAAQQVGNNLQADLAQAQIDSDVNKFNAQIETQRDQWNAANSQAIEQSNINFIRQTNTIDTAAENAANQQNVQNAFGVNSAEQAQLYLQVRDDANYLRQSYENEENRLAQLYMTAIGNESAAEDKYTSSLTALINRL